MEKPVGTHMNPTGTLHRDTRIYKEGHGNSRKGRGGQWDAIWGPCPRTLHSGTQYWDRNSQLGRTLGTKPIALAHTPDCTSDCHIYLQVMLPGLEVVSMYVSCQLSNVYQILRMTVSCTIKLCFPDSKLYLCLCRVIGCILYCCQLSNVESCPHQIK